MPIYALWKVEDAFFIRPADGAAQAADIADAVYYFAACARNTTGAELVVDGGNTIQLYPVVPADNETP